MWSAFLWNDLKRGVPPSLRRRAAAAPGLSLVLGRPGGRRWWGESLEGGKMAGGACVGRAESVAGSGALLGQGL